MPVGPRPRGPRLTVGDIFQTHGEAFRRSHALSESQRKAMRDIEACRTPVLGGRVDVCACCGLERPVFYSCRNRHCPTCQSLAQARWIESRMARVLPCDYFHVVFTVPDELLAPLAMRNRAVFFDILFSAASQTLLALGKDEKRLGALMGLTAVLHTWTRDLRFHPHVHCIVTGGGLDPEGRWKASKRDYLFPVAVLSKLFCGKVLAALDEVYRQGGLTLRGVEGFGGDVPDDVVWRRLLKKSYQQKWVSYAKPPFDGPDSVFQYLGRYTHRVGLSNHRLVSATDDVVTFHTWGEETASLHPHEFIRRFLQHVLPDGFVKVRHYGLLAPGNVNTKLATARDVLLRALPPPATPSPSTQGESTVKDDSPSWQKLLHRLTGIDASRCPNCGGPFISRPLLRPRPEDTS